MPPRDLSASSSFFLCKDKLPLSHDLIILWELVNELIDFTVIIGSQRKDNIADMYICILFGQTGMETCTKDLMIRDHAVCVTGQTNLG